MAAVPTFVGISGVGAAASDSFVAVAFATAAVVSAYIVGLEFGRTVAFSPTSPAAKPVPTPV